MANEEIIGPLLSPLRFSNGVTAKNRLWLAPMTNLQSRDDGSLSDDELRWLAVRAKGGFGVVETCAAHVAEDGQAWRGELGIFADRLVPGLARLAAAVAERGALGIVQLFHGGLRADPRLTSVPTWSASAIEEAGLSVPRAATEGDILGVIGRFRDAAVRARAAGFAGVELHGAHGYLLGQFLSATQNQRTDRWGGSWENRARLLRETLRAVRTAAPAPFVVGVRLSPEDWGQAKGLDLDENLVLARWLVDDGADFLHLSLWDATKRSRKRPEAHPLSLFRDVVKEQVTLVAAGGVWTRGEAEALLREGADAVAIGRAAIANPDWPLRVGDASWAPRRPPLTRAELRERGLSEAFALYLRNWKGFVAD
jgi:2,4-dienoyl-CoA reductase-like NADH-dependent reductase (Old Yellow Enzyme family)